MLRRARATTLPGDAAAVADAAAVQAAEQQRFNAAVDGLLAMPVDHRGQLADPAAFVDQAIAVARHHLVHARVDDLDRALEVFWVRMNLQRVVATEKLEELQSALSRLTLVNGIPQIVAEIEKRRSSAVSHSPGADECLAALSEATTGPGHANALQLLQRAARSLPEVQKLSGATGPACGGAAAQSQDDFHRQLRAAIRSMEAQERETLSTIVRGPVMTQVRAALGQIRQAPSLLAYPTLGAEIGFLITMMDAVRLESAPSPMGHSPEFAPVHLLDLSKDARAALAGIGIGIGTHGNVIVRSGVAGWESHRTVQAALAEIRIGQPMEDNKDLRIGKTCIDKELLPAMNGASFFVEAQGRRIPLSDASVRRFEPEARKQASWALAIEQLTRDVPMSPQELLDVSRVANLNFFKGLWSVIGSPSSPVCLPDGTPGQMVGDAVYSLSIRRQEGRLVVHGELKLSNASFLPAGKPSQEGVFLENGKNFLRLSMDVAVGPGKKVELAGPVEFEFEATPDTWASTRGLGYAKPKHPEDIYRLHSARSGMPHPLIAEFGRYLQDTEYSDENLQFPLLVDLFMSKPPVTYDGAAQLAATFLYPEAPAQLNLPSSLLLRAARVLDSERPDHAKLDELLRVLALARQEIVNLVQRDTFPRFVAALDRASSAAGESTPSASSSSAARDEIKGAGSPALARVVGSQDRANAENAISGLVGRLATPFLQPDKLPKLLERLGQALAQRSVRESEAGEPLRRLARAQIATLTPLQRAALQYHLEEGLPPKSAADANVAVIREVLADSRRAEHGRVEPRSLLLANIDQAATDSAVIQIVATWLREGKVSKVEVSQAFMKFQIDRLVVLASVQRRDLPVFELATLARTALAERHAASALAFIGSAEELMRMASGTIDPDHLRGFIAQVAQAAARYAAIERNPLVPSSNPVSKRIEDHRAQIAGKLHAMLLTAKLDPDQADLRASLESLRVEIPPPPPAEEDVPSPPLSAPNSPFPEDEEQPPLSVRISPSNDPSPRRTPGTPSPTEWKFEPRGRR